MDNKQSLQTEADSYEVISLRPDSSDVNSTSSTGSGIRLSDAEGVLATRVRYLQQENKAIREAIENYKKALQLCHNSLKEAIDREQETLSKTEEGYNKAKLKVLSLQKQLEEEKNKNSKLEEEALNLKLQSKKNDCEEKVDVSEKNNFEEKVCSLHEFVCALSALGPEERQTSISPDLLQALINLNVDLEKYVKPVALSGSTVSESSNVLKEKLKSVEEQLKHEQEKYAELETIYNELQHDIANKRMEGMQEVQEVQEELKLLNKEVYKVEMVRAGCVSRDSQDKESLYSDQREEKSVDTCSLPIQDPNLVKEIECLKRLLSKSERTRVSEKDKLKEEIEEKDKENDALKKENVEINKENDELRKENDELKENLIKTEGKLDDKVDGSQLEKAFERSNKLEQELLDQETELERTAEELSHYKNLEEQLKLKLNEYHLQLQEKENMEKELKGQVVSLSQDFEAKEAEYDDLKETFSSERDKMSSAFDEMRKELDTVYSQNQKLLKERKSASEAELIDLQSKIDNLTAQLVSAEEMMEHKDDDLRKLKEREKTIASELETVPLLKQQLEVFEADFNTERQTRQKVEEDNRKLRDEVFRLQADNDRLTEEANDPTGSKLLDMQRRHGCGSLPPGEANNAWTGFYNQFLAPRGPAVARSGSQQPPPENDMNRQVSGGRCPKCDLVFSDLDTLQTHVVRCLESESTASVGGKICPKCQGSFPDLDTLQIHVMECLDN